MAGILQGVEAAECEIALMQEYRTDLIAAAVTGKIDVRGRTNGTLSAVSDLSDLSDLSDGTPRQRPAL